jgi:hypothetical protein
MVNIQPSHTGIKVASKTYILWANVLLGKRLSGQKSYGQMSYGQLSIWANVFTGKHLFFLYSAVTDNERCADLNSM